MIDKLYPEAALRAAFAQVAANRGAAGVDHVTIAKYAGDLDANLARLSEALRRGTYRPQRIRRHYIAKPGSPEKRPPRDKPVGRRLTGIPTVQDRVVQTALRTVVGADPPGPACGRPEDMLRARFRAAQRSLPQRRPRAFARMGLQEPALAKAGDALRRVEGLLAAGYIHVVDADLKSYFDTIPVETRRRRAGSGDPHVRFGGRGAEPNRPSLPLSCRPWALAFAGVTVF